MGSISADDMKSVYAHSTARQWKFSFRDNAYDGTFDNETASMSLLLLVALHIAETSMRATLLKRIERPDGKYSFARGNMQVLDSGSIDGGWGDNAYITEHTSDGELLFEGSFEGDRFVNYRAHKFKFTADPIDWPVAKSFAAVTAQGTVSTIIYVKLGWLYGSS